MKKILFVVSLLVLTLTTTKAFEVKPFVGAEVSYNMTKLDKFKKDYRNNDWDPEYTLINKTDDAKQPNYGLNLGSRFGITDEFFVNFNLYYRFGKLVDDKIKTSWYWDLNDSNSLGHSQKIPVEYINKYGFNLGFGYNINDKLSTFIFYGLNNNELEIKDCYNTAGRLISGYKKDNAFVSSFGLGINYEIYENIEIKFSYEYILKTKFDLKMRNNNGYNYIEDKSKFTIGETHSIKLGLNYLFNI